MFSQPAHSHDENLQLYAHMNAKADELLAGGQSVVFDTSFNLHKDRAHLREIAAKHDCVTVLIWVSTSRELACKRAVHAPEVRNGYLEGMEQSQFDAIADKLEIPREDEKVIKIDGSKLDEVALTRLLQS
jgi:predicted kinase